MLSSCDQLGLWQKLSVACLSFTYCYILPHILTYCQRQTADAQPVLPIHGACSWHHRAASGCRGSSYYTMPWYTMSHSGIGFSYLFCLPLTKLCRLQSYVNLLDGVLALPANAVPVPLPVAGSGPNNGVGIETFNMTNSPAPPAMAVSTAG